MASVSAAGALLLLGGAPAGCDGPTPGPEVPAKETITTPDTLSPTPTSPATAPAASLMFSPPSPVAGQTVQISGGPIAFRNGCQGIAKVEHTVVGQKIEIRWTPKAVPPDAICTMALHDDPVVTHVEGLAAGRYQVVILPQGGSAELVVMPPPPDGAAPADGATPAEGKSK